MRISVFGLGYVGAVSSACFARNGHTVIGVDPDEHKLAPIREGRSPIVEKDLDATLAEAVRSGLLSVGATAEQAVHDTDLSLICVGTPSRENGDLKTDFVERVSHEIGEAMRSKSGYHCVVVRSTVLPGTTEGKVLPILEKSSGKKCGEQFGLAMNPEFLREGTAIKDFDKPPFTVIGALHDRDRELVAKAYAEVDGPVVQTAVKEAEMIKYICNCFHALKITFANEVGMLSKAMGVDGTRVMEIACMDTKLNVSAAYLKPGFAFGGSCLPKDVRAAAFRGRDLDVPTPLMSSLLASNQAQIDRVVSRLKATGKRTVALLGLSFKPGTDDLRESPLVTLAEQLIGKGFKLKIYDPNVSYAALHGSNRAYIEKEIPHLAEILSEDAERVMADAEIVIFGHNAPEFTALLAKTQPGQYCLDLARVGKPTDTQGVYDGLYW
jgi:GDP-mannose 6-dehydrogenase